MTVVFNATSVKNALEDVGFGGTIGSVYISPGYTGRVILAKNLAVTGSLSQLAGNFEGNGFTATVNGAATISGGTFKAMTAPQVFNGGLTVSGGVFVGSTGTVYTSKFTLSSGTMYAPTGTLADMGGNFTVTGGTFNADGGTVVLIGTNVAPTVAVGTGLVKFANFIDALTDTYPNGLTITGTLTTTGMFSWKAGAGIINGNIEAQGDYDDENHGGIGNPYLTIDGSANQTIKDLTGGGGGQFRTVTVNKSGGTLTLACSPIVFSGLTVTAGTINTGSYSWRLGGPLTASPYLNVGNVTIGLNVTVTGSRVQVANVVFAVSSARLTSTTGYLLVSGNWDDTVGAAFVANAGTVVFDGKAGTQFLTSGGQTFNNVIIATGSTVELESDVIIAGTLSNFGTLILNGHKVLK
jgi:hypothetical protein